MPRADSLGPAVATPLLTVSGLVTEFRAGGRPLRAVDGVSLHVHRGEVLGLVGESGSGKSVTALSIAGLLPGSSARVVAGEIRLDGVDLRALSPRELRALLGRRIGFIFQDPMSSLNPTLTIGFQLAEPLRRHLGLSRREAVRRAAEQLDRVGIARAAERLSDYPHQFSGGMRQRVMLAIALSCEPALLIADEPTTALDVTVQAQILELIRDMTRDLGTGVMLITHDLGVAAAVCDRVNVMYGGQIVESASTDELFAAPLMPYTRGLLACLPRLDDPFDAPFTPIAGLPPNPREPRRGCRFAPRCTHARPPCHAEPPALTPRGAARSARCYGTEAEGWLAW